MGLLLSTDEVQKLSLGVFGKAFESIEGPDVVKSAIETSSIREGRRQPAMPSIVKHAQDRVASSQVYAREPRRRCQVSPVPPSEPWVPRAARRLHRGLVGQHFQG